MKKLFCLIFTSVLLVLWLGTVSYSRTTDTIADSDPNIAINNNDSNDDLMEMSIDDLMNVEVQTVASITENNPLKTPASVTVITAEDIARTPARNILDLMEIYVPGVLYLNHSTGPQPAIRGIIADRPYKFLVTINGININIKAHYGARLELMNWDLNDIEKIEIIRGPGSVTYGPGAIGGVINITTKTGKQAEGFEYGSSYWNKYDSFGNYMSYGKEKDQSQFYSYLSIVRTQGTSPDLYGVDSDAHGYVGETADLNSNLPPFTYMDDYNDEPQVKAHFDIKFNDNWRFWGRYSSSSTNLIQGSATKFLLNDQYEDFRQTRYRYYQFAMVNNKNFDDDLTLKTTLAYSSTDVHNVEKFDTSYSIENDQDNLQNIGWIWSEDELFTQFMFKYDDRDQIKAALGFEYSYNTIGPGWGKDENDGLLLANGIISGPDSDFYGTGYRQITSDSSSYFAVGNGWNSYNYAVLGELNYLATDQSTIILSSRLDKHQFTDYMFSPRIALIQQIEQDQYLKFIAQRSCRMNTEDELYMSHAENEKNSPEELDTLELIYSGNFNEKTTYQASTFFNNADIIAWDWNSYRSSSLGKLKTFGIEFETAYKNDNLSCGFNHSFVKQIDWELNNNVSVSGISYSDYYVDAGDGVVITSNGNDLNNWPNNSTKLYTNLDMFNKTVTLHTDFITQWGFEGRKDGLEALANAGGDADSINDINARNAYDLEIKANLSLTFHLNKNADLTLFSQNIPVIGDNKRYSYSSGMKHSYPDKVSWIEEPTVVGVLFKARF